MRNVEIHQFHEIEKIEVKFEGKGSGMKLPCKEAIIIMPNHTKEIGVCSVCEREEEIVGKFEYSGDTYNLCESCAGMVRNAVNCHRNDIIAAKKKKSYDETNKQ